MTKIYLHTSVEGEERLIGKEERNKYLFCGMLRRVSEGAFSDSMVALEKKHDAKITVSFWRGRRQRPEYEDSSEVRVHWCRKKKNPVFSV